MVSNWLISFQVRLCGCITCDNGTSEQFLNLNGDFLYVYAPCLTFILQGDMSYAANSFRSACAFVQSDLRDVLSDDLQIT